MSLQPDLPVPTPEHPAPTTANGPVLQATPNGSAAMHPTRLPKAKHGNRMARFILPAAVLILLGGGLAVWAAFFRGPTARTDLSTAPLERVKVVQFKVVERGFLEAKDNNVITCDVKTGNRGAPKLKWVIENGTTVKGPLFAPTKMFGAFKIPIREGDLLAEIDDSYLRDQLVDQQIARDKAEQDWTQAEKAYPGLKDAVTVAESNLKKWIEGDFPQQRHDLEGQIQNSESTWLQQGDRTDWTARMVKKTYMTASQLEAERANLTGDKLALDQLREKLDVLVKYTNDNQLVTLKKAVVDARNAEQIGSSNVKINKAVFQQQQAKYDDLALQIQQCQIRAPNSGILAYIVPETTRGGFGSNQSIIAQGEPVQYGQKMMSIPDLSHMQVNLRIHEAFINHLNVKARVVDVSPSSPADKAGLKAGDIVTRFAERKIETYPDLANALRNYRDNQKGEGKIRLKVLRNKEEVDLELTLGRSSGSTESKATHSKDSSRHFGALFMPGLRAEVRIDSMPNTKPLRGHVSMVSAAAAQQDWMSPDVKVYQAYVEIDESVEDLKLKPGQSAVCTIFTETMAENVLAVPAQAILPATEPGGKPSVMVATANGGTESRPVKLLKIDDKLITDEKYTAIEEGLNEADVIVLNPRVVLANKKGGGKDGAKGAGAPPDAGGGRGKGKGPGGPPGQ